jgi:death-on-curing protein
VTWRWVGKQALLLLHDESLAEHGGATGIRDEGLLESTLGRPLSLDASGAPDFADLAASYAIGLAKNQAFVDGNERTAFLATGMFLQLNGYRLGISQVDAALAMLAVASGELDESGFAAWLRRHCVKR